MSESDEGKGKGVLSEEAVSTEVSLPSKDKEMAILRIKRFRASLQGRSFPDSTELIREDRER
jgi:hypothetical protein